MFMMCPRMLHGGSPRCEGLCCDCCKVRQLHVSCVPFLAVVLCLSIGMLVMSLEPLSNTVASEELGLAEAVVYPLHGITPQLGGIQSRLRQWVLAVAGIATKPAGQGTLNCPALKGCGAMVTSAWPFSIEPNLSKLLMQPSTSDMSAGALQHTATIASWSECRAVTSYYEQSSHAGTMDADMSEMCFSLCAASQY